MNWELHGLSRADGQSVLNPLGGHPLRIRPDFKKPPFALQAVGRSVAGLAPFGSKARDSRQKLTPHHVGIKFDVACAAPFCAKLGRERGGPTSTPNFVPKEVGGRPAKGRAPVSNVCPHGLIGRVEVPLRSDPAGQDRRDWEPKGAATACKQVPTRSVPIYSVRTPKA